MRSAGVLAEVASNEAPHQISGLLLRHDHGSTRWNRVKPGSAPVLRCTPGGPHLPPSPRPLPRCGRGRGRREAGAKERWPPSHNRRTGEDGGAERRVRKNGGPPHAIGARERTGETRGGSERTVASPSRNRRCGRGRGRGEAGAKERWPPPHAIGAAGEDGGE